MIPTSPAPTPVPSTAERIAALMGWQVHDSGFVDELGGYVAPLTEPAGAFRIIERMLRDGWHFTLMYRGPDRKWFCTFIHVTGSGEWEERREACEYAPSAPAAICAAAAAALASSGAAAGRAKGDSHD